MDLLSLRFNIITIRCAKNAELEGRGLRFDSYSSIPTTGSPRSAFVLFIPPFLTGMSKAVGKVRDDDG